MRLQFTILAICISLLPSFCQRVFTLTSDSKITPLSQSSVIDELASASWKSSAMKNALKMRGLFFTLNPNNIDVKQHNIVLRGRNSRLELPNKCLEFYIKVDGNTKIEEWAMTKFDINDNCRILPYAVSGKIKDRVIEKTAIQPKDIPIYATRVTPDIYRVSPKEELKTGEYCLYMVDSNSMPVEVYDFCAVKSNEKSIFPSDSEIAASFGVVIEQPAGLANAGTPHVQQQRSVEPQTRAKTSDVDINIPQSGRKSDETFALIISNENYKQVEPVPYAINDGEIFSRYLKNTLGLPDRNIIHLKDATLAEMRHAIGRLTEIAEIYDEPIRIIMHYSGHGIPNESTSEGYILPVDSYGNSFENAYKISDLYRALSRINSLSTVVFLDACFSGSQRDGKMIASSRGVAIKVKKDTPLGNIVALTAAQNDQTAYPYTEQQHGLMTYFILKKIQETKGNLRLGELTDYVIKNVKRESVLTNGKKQEPSVVVNESNINWRDIKLID